MRIQYHEAVQQPWQRNGDVASNKPSRKQQKTVEPKRKAESLAVEVENMGKPRWRYGDKSGRHFT